MNKKSAVLVGAGVAGASYVAYRSISDEMMKRIFNRVDYKEVTDAEYLDWLASSNAVKVTVKSFDGLKLSAYSIHNHDDDRYIIMVHGKGLNKSRLYPQAKRFDALGYNILLIDQRCAGDSEGEYYTYGLKESQDLQIWISYLVNKYPEVKICLYGFSMGAATVMMAAGYQLSDQVKCIVEESGFSSMKEQLDYVIKKDYKLALTYPVLKMLESQTKERFGFSFEDISAKRCLEENEIPILFVHGEKDELVPFDMAKILYNHNKGEKKYYPIADAGHGECSNDENFFINVDRFICSHM